MEKKAFEELKATFASGKTKPHEYREAQLQSLLTGIRALADEIAKAIAADLGRSDVEALQEVVATSAELQLVLASFKKWMEPEVVPTPPLMAGAKSLIYSRPKGVVLIISPFNFPFVLALAPLMGAIAAGNCAIIKPSEVSAHTAQSFKSLGTITLTRLLIE